jgi:hypothetical protein
MLVVIRLGCSPRNRGLGAGVHQHGDDSWPGLRQAAAWSTALAKHLQLQQFSQSYRLKTVGNNNKK